MQIMQSCRLGRPRWRFGNRGWRGGLSRWFWHNGLWLVGLFSSVVAAGVAAPRIGKTMHQELPLYPLSNRLNLVLPRRSFSEVGRSSSNKSCCSHSFVNW